MNTDKLIKALEERRDDFNRHRDDYDNYKFYQALATIDAIEAVIYAVAASKEPNE